jgi:hypothetical protein
MSHLGKRKTSRKADAARKNLKLANKAIKRKQK